MRWAGRVSGFLAASLQNLRNAEVQCSQLTCRAFASLPCRGSSASVRGITFMARSDSNWVARDFSHGCTTSHRLGFTSAFSSETRPPADAQGQELAGLTPPGDGEGGEGESDVEGTEGASDDSSSDEDDWSNEATDGEGSEESSDEGGSEYGSDDEFIREKELKLKELEAPEGSGSSESEAEGGGAAEESLPEDREMSISEADVMAVKSASKKKQKFLLQNMLRIKASEPEEDDRFSEDLDDPMAFFKMKIIDVNRTAKGTKAGVVNRFSAMVVVGNMNGVLGHGVGKSMDVPSAVKKAYARALTNLVYIPRYHGQGIYTESSAKYGKVKVILYPRTLGEGMVCNNTMMHIMKLAGIHDIGIKVIGSRNPRNTIKALFDAFDKMPSLGDVVNSQDRWAVEMAVGNKHIADFVGLLKDRDTVP